MNNTDLDSTDFEKCILSLEVLIAKRNENDYALQEDMVTLIKILNKQNDTLRNENHALLEKGFVSNPQDPKPTSGKIVRIDLNGVIENFTSNANLPTVGSIENVDNTIKSLEVLYKGNNENFMFIQQIKNLCLVKDLLKRDNRELNNQAG
jgi:uncharacterized protein Yka (UPF0111/DUF47 family)